MASEAVFLRYVWRAWRFAAWIFRKTGVSDYLAALILFAVAALLNIACLAQGVRAVREYAPLTLDSVQVIRLYANVSSLFAIVFSGLYMHRLRVVGIVSVDRSIETGKDYRSALDEITEGFDFLGIGAAKLTARAKEFEGAISRIRKHQKKARILLCDPRCKIIDALERGAGVQKGRYQANVKQSFTLLQHLHGEFAGFVEIRLYRPESELGLPPFRLMFINEETCLVSQVVVGAPKEGRVLPQVHVRKKAISEQLPNFYRAYATLFERLWETSVPVTSVDFAEIAQLSVTRDEVAAHA